MSHIDIDAIVLWFQRIPSWILGYAIMPLWLLISVAIMISPIPFITQLGLHLPLFWYPVFYWVLTRPHWLPPGLIFLFALGLDFWGHHVIGVTTLSILITTSLIRFQRRLILGQGFWISWLAFAMTLSVYTALIWLSSSLITLNITPITMGYLLGPVLMIVAYPALVPFLSGSDRLITDARRTLHN